MFLTQNSIYYRNLQLNIWVCNQSNKTYGGHFIVLALAFDKLVVYLAVSFNAEGHERSAADCNLLAYAYEGRILSLHQ